jgi:6-pyruvoyltetrahydropterin/6-carboxytetrahydropterin synthase
MVSFEPPPRERLRAAGVQTGAPAGILRAAMGHPVFEISKDFVFSAAHQIRFHGGKCERLHGHNWRVRVHVRASELNRIGMVIDFADLQKVVGEVGSRFDHQNVNEIPPFDEVNTTAELLARFFYTEVGGRLAASESGRVAVSKVEVWENEGSLAVYREE